MSVSIVVPCRNEARHIEAFLASVLTQDPVPGRPAPAIIVADGMSDDGTREKIQAIGAAHPRVRMIDNPGRIVSAGLNRAVREARGRIIVRMDVHSEYARDYVAESVRLLEATGADNVGGPARTKAASYMQGAIALAYHSPFSVGGARFHDPTYEGFVDTVTYGCWRKRFLEEIGMFDEELVRNQDDELNLRIIRRGGKIWQSPSIRSWYYPRGSIKALFRQYAQYGYWKVRVIQKHRIPASLRHLVPGAFVAALIVLLILSPMHSVFPFALGFFAGLYVLVSVCASTAACGFSRALKYLPIMPCVFAAYHFGYGYGFLRAIVDFYVLKRGARPRFTDLSRRPGT